MVAEADWLIIGGGLAGCAAAYHLSRAGATVILAEASETLAAGASGNLAGALYPLFTADGNATGQYFCQALDYALTHYEQLQAQWPEILWVPSGLLQLCNDSDHAVRLQKIAAHPLYAPFVRWVSATEARAIANAEVDECLFIYRSGYVFPTEACRAYVSVYAHNITILLKCLVNSCTRQSSHWLCTSEQNHRLKARKILVANAFAAQALPITSWLPLGRTRGQLSYVRATTASASLRLPVCGKGYVLPAVQGIHVVGATYHRDHFDSRQDDASHASNSAEAQRLLPSLFSQKPEIVGGRTSIRCSFPNHLPAIGLMNDCLLTFNKRHYAPPEPCPDVYLSLGHGSRGLITTTLPVLVRGLR